MKIKVALVDSDKRYLDGVLARFMSEYSEDIELYLWLNTDNLSKKVMEKGIKIAVINSLFKDEEELFKLPCPILFIDENNANGKIGDIPVTPKYQNIAGLYKKILGIFSDISDIDVNHKKFGMVRVIAFTSPAGGVGTSTLAVSCAVNFARQGLKAAYLNFEDIPTYFFANDEYGFEEVLYAIANGKGNLSTKLESMVKESPEKVMFLPRITNILDLKMLTSEYKKILIKAMTEVRGVSYVILDLSFKLDKEFYSILDMADDIVFVSDGSENSNRKLFSSLQAISLAQGDYSIDKKISILYNKFSAGSPVGKLTGIEQKELGVLDRAKMNQKDLVNKLSASKIFDSLM